MNYKLFIYYFILFINLFFNTILKIIETSSKNTIEGRIRITSKNTWIIETENFSEDYNYIATAYYESTLLETGWDTFAITTNNLFSDEIQAEAAGRLEASLTKDHIYNHYLNAKSSNGDIDENVINFFKNQEDYLINKYKENPNDVYYYNAYLLYKQFYGLRDQYNKEVSDEKKIEDMKFNIINSFGDIFDIKAHFNIPNFKNMTTKELIYYTHINTHCSALYKLTNDLSDLYFGHNSWYYYTMMSKMFKEYNLNFNHPSIKAKNVMFSSYPGSLVSNDDFYITSQDLNIIETTNANYNSDSYKLITHESLLCWQRVQIANRMSTSSEEWVNNFAKYNSGTYNNMYMALDMKKFIVEKKTLLNDALYIIEQMPNMIKINDVTNIFKFGYWPSYNVPFDKEISEYAQIPQTLKEHPEMKSEIDYDLCARAKIFRRNQSEIKNFDDFKNIMRYNNYLDDEYSEGDPMLTISSRGDIKEYYCGGAFDAKAAKISDLKGKEKKIYLVGGPTYNDKIEAFKWKESKICEGLSWEGLSNEAKFDWIVYTNKFQDV